MEFLKVLILPILLKKILIIILFRWPAEKIQTLWENKPHRILAMTVFKSVTHFAMHNVHVNTHFEVFMYAFLIEHTPFTSILTRVKSNLVPILQHWNSLRDRWKNHLNKELLLWHNKVMLYAWFMVHGDIVTRGSLLMLNSCKIESAYNCGYIGFCN